jgi:hypothetical protein
VSKTNLNEVEAAYHKAGFRTVQRDDEAISFAKKAPVVVVDSKGRTRLMNGTTAGSPLPKKKRSSAPPVRA